MNPSRIVLILPCCIGDVVLATATLKALRQGFPNAHITWAVGSWSAAAVAQHPLLNAVLDTGPAALPVKSPIGLWRFVRQLRAGCFDMAVSLVRSPLMSAAALLSGIPARVGLDSGGRGFGYTLRVPIDPRQPRHEADIYLQTARALGLDTTGCWANIPVPPPDLDLMRARLSEQGITGAFIVLNPAGGRNPGMVFDVKRWPPDYFAALADRLARRWHMPVVLVGGPADGQIVRAVQTAMQTPAHTWIGALSFAETAALARLAQVYVGNDTGFTHLAAAAGAKTVMILGPSDPTRYAPYTPDSLAVWKPAAVTPGGVAQGAPKDWDWQRDGVSVDEVEARIMDFLAGAP